MTTVPVLGIPRLLAHGHAEGTQANGPFPRPGRPGPAMDVADGVLPGLDRHLPSPALHLGLHLVWQEGGKGPALAP